MPYNVDAQRGNFIMLGPEETYQRVRKVNNTLREAGMDWEEIEAFWDGIFKECKKKPQGAV